MRPSDELVLTAIAGRRVGGNGWVRANCPTCETRVGKVDRKQCLGLHVPTAKYLCHRCGWRGWVAQMPDDLAELKRRLAVEPEAQAATKAMEPPDGFYSLFSGAGARALSLDVPRRYLTAPKAEGGRGLDVGVLREAQVGACVAGKYAGRVVVPVLGSETNDRGELPWYGYSTRPWVARYAGLGYRYPEGMALSELIYHHAALLVVTDTPVLVCEGVFDAHALWPDAVAALGGTKEGHYDALHAARRPVCMVPDGDAWEKGWLFAMRLRFEGQRAGALRLPPRVDPDEIPRAEIEQAAVASLSSATGIERL